MVEAALLLRRLPYKKLPWSSFTGFMEINLVAGNRNGAKKKNVTYINVGNEKE